MNKGSVWWEGEDTVSRRWHSGLLESKGWGVFWGPGGGDVVGLAGGHWREKVGGRLREGNGRCVRRRLLIGRRQLHCLSLHPGLKGAVKKEINGKEWSRRNGERENQADLMNWTLQQQQPCQALGCLVASPKLELLSPQASCSCTGSTWPMKCI